MKDRILEQVTFINRPLTEVFDFFSKAENLNLLTPPKLDFKIVTPQPFAMEKGTEIDYQLKFFKVPFAWKTLISDWKTNAYFIDVQLKGPYAKWEHTHLFEEENGGTKMTDTIIYRSPGFIFEPIIHHLFVKRNLYTIFNYRQERCKELFG
jgi:ligand-binding SRPBCC domain-containing protein